MNGKRIVVVVGVLAAAGLGYASLKGYFPPKSGLEGTIGGAKRYQAQQIADKDVVTQDPQVQEFLQSDLFHGEDGTLEFHKNDGTVEFHKKDGTSELYKKDGTVEYSKKDGTIEYGKNTGTVEYGKTGGTTEYSKTGGTTEYSKTAGTTESGK